MLTNQQKYNLIYRKFEGHNQEGHPLCPLCGSFYRVSRQEQSLDIHLQKYHSEIYDECKEVLNTYNTAKAADKVVCPICKKQLTSLARHLHEIHGYQDLNDFKLQFPETPITVKAARPRIRYFKCDFCGKKFESSQGFAAHLKHIHNITSIKSAKNDDNKPFTREICKKKIHCYKRSRGSYP